MNNLKSILVLAVIILTSLVSGCSEDKKSSTAPVESNIPQDLLGTWYYQSATVNGVPVALSYVLQWDEGTVAARFTVGSDGSLVNEELDDNDEVVWTETGTITIDGDNATITITADDDGPIDPPDVLSGTWSLNDDGDELTLTGDYLGYPVIFVTVRTL